MSSAWTSELYGKLQAVFTINKSLADIIYTRSHYSYLDIYINTKIIISFMGYIAYS